MNQKYFKGDKNYLLEEAQLHSKELLIATLFRVIKEQYTITVNPLGLVDSTTRAIQDAQLLREDWQDLVYQQLSAIYRFLNSDNQLTLVFDGRSNKEVYTDEWKLFLINYIQESCQHSGTLKLWLRLLIFNQGQRGQELAVTRLRQCINQHFNVRFHKTAGIKAA